MNKQCHKTRTAVHIPRKRGRRSDIRRKRPTDWRDWMEDLYDEEEDNDVEDKEEDNLEVEEEHEDNLNGFANAVVDVADDLNDDSCDDKCKEDVQCESEKNKGEEIKEKKGDDIVLHDRLVVSIGIMEVQDTIIMTFFELGKLGFRKWLSRTIIKAGRAKGEVDVIEEKNEIEEIKSGIMLRTILLDKCGTSHEKEANMKEEIEKGGDTCCFNDEWEQERQKDKDDLKAWLEEGNLLIGEEVEKKRFTNWEDEIDAEKKRDRQDLQKWLEAERKRTDEEKEAEFKEGFAKNGIGSFYWENKEEVTKKKEGVYLDKNTYDSWDGEKVEDGANDSEKENKELGEDIEKGRGTYWEVEMDEEKKRDRQDLQRWLEVERKRMEEEKEEEFKKGVVEDGIVWFHLENKEENMEKKDGVDLDNVDRQTDVDKDDEKGKDGDTDWEDAMGVEKKRDRQDLQKWLEAERKRMEEETEAQLKEEIVEDSIVSFHWENKEENMEKKEGVTLKDEDRNADFDENYEKSEDEENVNMKENKTMVRAVEAKIEEGKKQDGGQDKEEVILKMVNAKNKIEEDDEMVEVGEKVNTKSGATTIKTKRAKQQEKKQEGQEMEYVNVNERYNFHHFLRKRQNDQPMGEEVEEVKIKEESVLVGIGNDKDYEDQEYDTHYGIRMCMFL